MKKMIFVSDFDGTISQKDFYKMVMTDLIGQEAIDCYEAWKKTEKIGVTFLNRIFLWRTFTEAEIKGVLDQVPFDPTFIPFYHTIKDQMDFMILSAGFDYYIHELLVREGIGEVNLVTNPGQFKEGVLRINEDPSLPYYSPVYGIDKSKVIKQLKASYETVVFVGDSEPDYWAAIEADVVFAKAELIELMANNQKPCFPINDFSEVMPLLIKATTKEANHG